MTFLTLFVLRIADDIVSVDDDRLTNPTRALPSGRVGVPALTSGATVLTVATIVCSLGRPSLGLFILGGYYTGYFLCYRRIPVALRPWFANIIFLAIPVQMYLVLERPAGLSLCALGAFFWLSAVGHDYAHSVHAAGESHPDVPSASMILGSRNVAILGLVCYVAAFAVGTSLACGLTGCGLNPMLFFTGMTLLLLRVSFLLIRLVADPRTFRARPLYVPGFAFFLLPSLLLWLDRLLGI